MLPAGAATSDRVPLPVTLASMAGLSQSVCSEQPDGRLKGRTSYTEADFREPASILDAPELREPLDLDLDLDRPVALTVIAIVRRLLESLPPGSHLAMTIGTAEFAPEEVGRVARDMPMRLRTIDEAHGFFEGLDLVGPGIVQVHKRHPDGTGEQGVRDEDIAMYGAIARKP